MICICSACFSSLLDIGKLIRDSGNDALAIGFSSLLDIGKLILPFKQTEIDKCFSSLLDIGKLILTGTEMRSYQF